MLIYENRTRKIEAYMLDREHWDDFALLFGERGACGGCWCMYWRLKKAQFEAQKGEKNKQAMRQLVENGQPVGVLLYIDSQPAGWCAAAPREEYKRL
ncbi:hypothetical protein NIE88_14515 [Sporolactobacillus shoreicorticis]|uniref:Uncharacterized protein n=1 Tax=Sporolactobacillus shoreicorticis TaxID=1923877 RepID=A0ABW5S1T0_9BACL|nr:hypothetical protein [Sporolactobacillus shoreicorticis]MCO7126981.1 hypothetical protein [Sporolactobacillus shoreicorticis]